MYFAQSSSRLSLISSAARSLICSSVSRISPSSVRCTCQNDGIFRSSSETSKLRGHVSGVGKIAAGVRFDGCSGGRWNGASTEKHACLFWKIFCEGLAMKYCHFFQWDLSKRLVKVHLAKSLETCRWLSSPSYHLGQNLGRMKRTLFKGAIKRPETLRWTRVIRSTPFKSSRTLMALDKRFNTQRHHRFKC